MSPKETAKLVILYDMRLRVLEHASSAPQTILEIERINEELREKNRQQDGAGAPSKAVEENAAALRQEIVRLQEELRAKSYSINYLRNVSEELEGKVTALRAELAQVRIQTARRCSKIVYLEGGIGPGINAIRKEFGL